MNAVYIADHVISWMTQHALSRGHQATLCNINVRIAGIGVAAISLSNYTLSYVVCMLHSVPGKPGARKRKLGPLAPAAAGGTASMDVIPASLLVKPTFQPPKVRKPGA